MERCDTAELPQSALDTVANAHASAAKSAKAKSVKGALIGPSHITCRLGDPGPSRLCLAGIAPLTGSPPWPRTRPACRGGEAAFNPIAVPWAPLRGPEAHQDGCTVPRAQAVRPGGDSRGSDGCGSSAAAGGTGRTKTAFLGHVVM